MLTLSLDTTAEFGSIAVLEDTKVLAEALVHAPHGFSQVLFGRLRGLLEAEGIQLPDIDLYASASGPGSFTGVRVGLAAVKGLAEVFNRPVIAVSNLRALAEFGSLDLRATIIDARRGEVYAAVYDSRGRAVLGEQVVAFPRFVAELPANDFEWICSDFDPFYTGQKHVTKAPRELAAAIGQVALSAFKEGGAVFAPEAIDANYVRRSDAELLFRST